MARKNILTALAMAVGLAVTAPAINGCVSIGSTTSNSSTTDRTQIMLVSEAEVNQAAVKNYNDVLTKARLYKNLNTDAKSTKRVKAIGQKLIAKAPMFRPDSKNWNWEINVIDSGDVNAQCMPGGKIVVFTGLLNAVKPTDDELAVVIGHEIAHALREHSREAMSAEYAKQTALSLASYLGIDQQKLSIGESLSNIGFSLPFSRSHETEADELGLELVYAAGYNPDAAATLWTKMNALSGSSNALADLLSTHPSGDDRIENLTALANRLKAEKAAKGDVKSGK